MVTENEGGTRLAFRYPDPGISAKGGYQALSPEQFIPQLFIPKHILHNQIVDVVIGGSSRFISYCVSESHWNTGISAFNVVVEVPEVEANGKDKRNESREGMGFVKRILVDIAASLNFEENRQKFVSQEVKCMIKVCTRESREVPSYPAELYD